MTLTYVHIYKNNAATPQWREKHASFCPEYTCIYRGKNSCFTYEENLQECVTRLHLSRREGRERERKEKNWRRKRRKKELYGKRWFWVFECVFYSRMVYMYGKKNKFFFLNVVYLYALFCMKHIVPFCSVRCKREKYFESAQKKGTDNWKV